MKKENARVAQSPLDNGDFTKRSEILDSCTRKK
jgi:hypothetical protein